MKYAVKSMLAIFGSIQATQLTKVVNLREPLDTMTIELYIITCANEEFKVQREVVELERFITQPMDKDSKYSNGLVATRKFQFVFHTCGESNEVVLAAGS